MTELNGYIKLHRKLISWGWYQDNVIKSLFLHLLLTASFKETKWRNTTIKKGQLVTSYKRLADDLGFTVQQVRTALKKLESTGEITSKSTNKFTLITVTNWEEYQFNRETSTSSLTNEQQTTNKQITNKQQTTNNIVRNIKNVNNDKNDKNIDPRLAAELASAGIGYDEYLRIKNQ